MYSVYQNVTDHVSHSNLTNLFIYSFLNVNKQRGIYHLMIKYIPYQHQRCLVTPTVLFGQFFKDISEVYASIQNIRFVKL